MVSDTGSMKRLLRWMGLAVLLGALGYGLHLAVITTLPFLISTTALPAVWSETFAAPTLDQWREVSLHGHTRYEICEVDANPCLCATSTAAASILLHKLHVETSRTLRLEWRWRVDELVEGEALDQKGGSDAAARLYVYFDTGTFPWQKRSLNYVWSASAPVGTILTSAFSARAKIIVVESGREHLGRWRTVTRNLAEDYYRAFGDEPPAMVAVGLMSDSDNTRSSTSAYFDDLRLSELPQAAADTVQ